MPTLFDPEVAAPSTLPIPTPRHRKNYELWTRPVQVGVGPFDMDIHKRIHALALSVTSVPIRAVSRIDWTFITLDTLAESSPCPVGCWRETVVQSMACVGFTITVSIHGVRLHDSMSNTRNEYTIALSGPLSPLALTNIQQIDETLTLRPVLLSRTLRFKNTVYCG